MIASSRSRGQTAAISISSCPATPEPTEVGFPLLLPDNPAPIIKAYPKETVIAEKLEAIVTLGMANSRMKDYFRSHRPRHPENPVSAGDAAWPR